MVSIGRWFRSGDGFDRRPTEYGEVTKPYGLGAVNGDVGARGANRP